MMNQIADPLLLEEGRVLLQQYFREIGILSDQEIDEVITLTRYGSLSKGEYFISEDRTCHSLVFVFQGMLRSYFTKDDGEEVTYCFTFPKNLMTAYSSFITGKPTAENIQALTKTHLLVFRKEDLEKLTRSNSNWIRLQKFFAEQQYIALEQRIFAYQKEKALS